MRILSYNGLIMVLLIVGMILIDRIFSIQASATFSVEYGLQADLMVVLEIEDETRVETFEVDNMVTNIYSIEVETFEVTIICSRYGHWNSQLLAGQPEGK